MNRLSAILFCVVTTITIPVAVTRAQANETIQGMCSTQARQSWPDDYRYGQNGRAQQQVYINCMTEHGLRP